MRTRTRGIHLAADGERIVNKQHRGERIFARLGKVSQDDAEAWLRQQQAELDARRAQQLRQGDEQLFRTAAGKYLMELQASPDVRTLETISWHIVLLNAWIGNLPLREVCNDSFAAFKADRLAGLGPEGRPLLVGSAKRRRPAAPVKPATVNRSLEVASTVLHRAARVWRSNGRPWLATAPLIEMLDESGKRKPYPLSWSEQSELLRQLPSHLQRMRSSR